MLKMGDYISLYVFCNKKSSKFTKKEKNMNSTLCAKQSVLKNVSKKNLKKS